MSGFDQIGLVIGVLNIVIGAVMAADNRYTASLMHFVIGSIIMARMIP